MRVSGIYFLLLFSLRVKVTELSLIVSFLQMASSLHQQTVMAICVSLDMVQVIVIARSVSWSYMYNIRFLDLSSSVLKQVTIHCMPSQNSGKVFLSKGRVSVYQCYMQLHVHDQSIWDGCCY